MEKRELVSLSENVRSSDDGSDVARGWSDIQLHSPRQKTNPTLTRGLVLYRMVSSLVAASMLAVVSAANRTEVIAIATRASAIRHGLRRTTKVVVLFTIPRLGRIQ
jgi:hypothetical protein